MREALSGLRVESTSTGIAVVKFAGDGTVAFSGMRSEALRLQQEQANMAARWEAAARTMTGATGEVTDASHELASQVGKTRKQLTVFAGMTEEELNDWAKSVGQDLRDISGLLGDLAQDGKVTAREILKSFRDQAEALAGYRRNWETVIQRGLPDELAQQIAEMGLDGARILQALANASDQRFREIVRAFEKGQTQAKRTEQAIRAVGQAINALPSHKTMTISVEIQKSVLASGAGGHGVQLQHGGVVTRPTVALIGEAGPEAVIPLRNLRPSEPPERLVVVFEGPVYGFSDFEGQVVRALDRAARRRSIL
jgi:hypothetical protein